MNFTSFSKTACLRLLLCLCWVLLLLVSPAQAAEKLLTITADAPCVGRPIEASFDFTAYPDAVLTWSSSGLTLAQGSSYTPTAADYESFLSVTATDADGSVLACESIYFSKLPVVYLDTQDAKPVESREEYMDASVCIQGNSLHAAQYEGEAKVKGRGTSSWHYDKKPYRLKLKKEADLFGFGESKNYVLLANYLDPSLLRNTVGYRFSSFLGLRAADTVWVDLIFNGEYVGCYQLCEHVRPGAQLVDIFDWEDYAATVAAWINAEDENLKGALTENLSWVTAPQVTYNGKAYDLTAFEAYEPNIHGGYFFELDSEYDKEPSHIKTSNGINVCVSSPKNLYTNAEMMHWVQDYFQSAEDALCSETGYNKSGQHYTELIDFDSMLNYWLCMEILSNEDAAARSRFCSIDLDGKLVFGPAWDFDISSGSFRSFFGETGWNVTGTVTGWYEKQDFWKEFVDDPYFQLKAQERYWRLRPVLTELVRDGGIIDSYTDDLYEAGSANELLWTADGYMTRSFTGTKGDGQLYKAFLTKRLAWLDTVFASEDSTTKQLYSFLSAAPYRKSPKVSLQIENAEQQSDAKSASYVMTAPCPVRLAVDAPQGATLEFYVNGLSITPKAELNGASVYLLPTSCLTEPEGCKNVISVIARKGSRSYKNYVSLSVGSAADTSLESRMLDAFLLPDSYVVADGSAQSGQSLPCSHVMTHLAAREASATQYGLEACWYCNRCLHYFLDEAGTQPLDAKQVITSVATSEKPGGTPLRVRELTVIAAIVLFAASTGLVFLLRFLFKRCRARTARNHRPHS